jgi:Meckel syndrome type 1 protein
MTGARVRGAGLLAAALAASGCTAAGGLPDAAPGGAGATVGVASAPAPAAAPAEGWTARGARLLRAGRGAAAARAYRRALLEEGTTLPALVGLGAAHRAMGLTREARRTLSRAAGLWPDSPVARNGHGAALYDLGLYAAAESEFRAAAGLMARRGVAPSREILRNLDLAVRARARTEPPAAGAPPPRSQPETA